MEGSARDRVLRARFTTARPLGCAIEKWRAKIVFKEIISDDDGIGYDDARTREIQENISDDDTGGFSRSDTPSGGGRSGVAISLLCMGGLLVGTYSFF